MNLLLDTHVFLWVIHTPDQVSEDVLRILADVQHQIWLSVASLWEISIKYGQGKLRLPEEPDRYLVRQRERAHIASLPISEAAVTHVHRLPPIHRDPFDRLLIGQAICAGMTIATADADIRRYPVPTIW